MAAQPPHPSYHPQALQRLAASHLQAGANTPAPNSSILNAAIRDFALAPGFSAPTGGGRHHGFRPAARPSAVRGRGAPASGGRTDFSRSVAVQRAQGRDYPRERPAIGRPARPRQRGGSEPQQDAPTSQPCARFAKGPRRRERAQSFWRSTNSGRSTGRARAGSRDSCCQIRKPTSSASRRSVRP